MGGIEFAAEALRDCWREDGHEVTWISTDDPKGGAPSTPDNVRIPCWNFLEHQFQINTPLITPLHRARIRQLVASHDVINPHSLAPGLSIMVMNEALRQRKPLVVTQHVAVIPLKLPALSWLQKKYICSMARRAQRGNAVITFVGKAVREWFEATAGLNPAGLAMTPAGINQGTYFYVPQAERSAFREKWKCSDAKLNVLFVGRFYDKKGLPLIREVAQMLPDVQFTLVGGGPVDPSTWNQPNVRIISFVNNRDLRELYGAHDLFIMPSYGEGWPAVVPQAMICGTKCLISEECFTGYQKDPGQFLICRRTVSSIADALNSVRDIRSLSESDRKATSDYAAATWDWMTTARIYLDLFNRQIARSQQGA